MFFNSIKVGFFLATRFILRTNKWMSAFIIFVMFLTFINLVVVSGILVGLIEGSIQGYRKTLTSDVYLSNVHTEPYIRNISAVEDILDKNPYVDVYVKRYLNSTTVLQEGERSKVLAQGDKEGFVIAPLISVTPSKEAALSELDQRVVRGSYLDDDDVGSILVGALLTDEFSPFGDELRVFENLQVGDYVYVRYTSGFERKYRVKGFVRTKNEVFDFGIITNINDSKQFLGASGVKPGFIPIRAKKPEQAALLKASLIDSGLGKYAEVRAYDDVSGEYLNNIKVTFNILGIIVGLISLVASSITLFVIIFITAITRRRFIGVLKGIGVPVSIIKSSYVFLSIFYGLSGVVLGMLVTYFVLLPYFNANPIDFPFSDGILYVTNGGTFIRSMVILLSAALAGLIPAWMITRQNTLDAILGR